MVATPSERGFTVVELVCAFAVVSVLALSLVHTGYGHDRSMARAFHETLALRLAQAEVEAARAHPADLRVGEGPFALLSEAGPLPGGHGWRAVREVAPGLLEVEVSVRWLPAGAEQEATVGLITRVAGREEAR